jgi:hypothetical protein
MDPIAGGTFECPDVEARWTGCDACQHRFGLAIRAKWSMDEHDASPWFRRERYRTLSHRWTPKKGAVMSQYVHLILFRDGQYSSHARKMTHQRGQRAAGRRYLIDLKRRAARFPQPVSTTATYFTTNTTNTPKRPTLTPKSKLRVGLISSSPSARTRRSSSVAAFRPVSTWRNRVCHAKLRVK